MLYIGVTGEGPGYLMVLTSAWLTVTLSGLMVVDLLKGLGVGLPVWNVTGLGLGLAGLGHTFMLGTFSFWG